MWLSIWVESRTSLACYNTVVNIASSLYPRGNLHEIDPGMPIRQLNDNSIFWYRGSSFAVAPTSYLACTILVPSHRPVAVAHALPKTQRATTSAHALDSGHAIKVYKKSVQMWNSVSVEGTRPCHLNATSLLRSSHVSSGVHPYSTPKQNLHAVRTSKDTRTTIVFGAVKGPSTSTYDVQSCLVHMKPNLLVVTWL